MSLFSYWEDLGDWYSWRGSPGITTIPIIPSSHPLIPFSFLITESPLEWSLLSISSFQPSLSERGAKSRNQIKRRVSLTSRRRRERKNKATPNVLVLFFGLWSLGFFFVLFCFCCLGWSRWLNTPGMCCRKTRRAPKKLLQDKSIRQPSLSTLLSQTWTGKQTPKNWTGVEKKRTSKVRNEKSTTGYH